MEQNPYQRGLVVQFRCLKALMLRDMMKRYGRANIGFLWVILEPMILTAGVMVVWSLVKPPYEHGLQIVSLVLTGYMPLTLWRHVTNCGVRMFQGSMALLYHRHISLMDIYIARVALEFVGTTTALVFVYCVLLAAGLVAPIDGLGLVIAAWVIMFLLSAGAASVIAIMTEYSEVTERFIQPFQYLMLPLSGTFFMVEWLPTEGRDLIWYNPTVHCFEMFRAGFFGDEVTTHFTAWYPILWCILLSWLGLTFMDAVRDRIHTG